MKLKFTAIVLSAALLIGPRSARADFFGGDVVVLTQILAQAIQTVVTLRNILANGQDTLDLMRDINSGVKSGIDLLRIINPNFNPGVYGNLSDPDAVLRAIESVYGTVPRGMDEDLMRSQDQSVAEVIAMNRDLYDFADQMDRERDRIVFHSQVVSPQGAGKLQNQATAVLIGVTTQLLRTQSQMLKIMAQNMAFETRKEKLATRNFQENYHSLSRGFEGLPKESNLPRLGGNR